MTSIALLFVAASQAFSLPPGLLSALCFVESSHRPYVINIHDGGSPSIGICQLKLTTARSLGFRGSSKELKRPGVNIYFAAKYLHSKIEKNNGNLVRAIAAYNRGSYKKGRKGMPINVKYVYKVLEAWGKNK